MSGGSRSSKYWGILEVTLWSLKMLEIFNKSRPLLTNLILMNCVFGGSDGTRGNSLLNENEMMILSFTQSKFRILLRSASSRIGFNLDTGIEESACNSSCRPLFLAIRRRSSKDLFSLCFLLERPLRRTPWDRRFLCLFGFKEKILMVEWMDEIFPCW